MNANRSIAVAGLVLWAVSLGIWGGEVFGSGWIVVLLVFACAVMMPLSLGLVPGDSVRLGLRLAILVGSAAIIASFLCDVGVLAALLVVSWLGICTWLAGSVFLRWLRFGVPSTTVLALDSARVFPLVGAAWLLANRAGWMPFGFDALIVLLTAAHFHHAGFTLPLLAGRVAMALPGRWAVGTCMGVLAGVPSVAFGITATHFKVIPWLEPLAVTLVASGSVSVAVLQLKLAAMRGYSCRVQMFWVLSSVCHLAAMLLALGFGLRSWFPAFALPMPQMWAIHGSLNAFGFGLAGILGWISAAQPDSKSHEYE